MKVLVTYSSLTGNTERLAQGIYDGLEVETKEIRKIRDVDAINAYDIIFIGYWVDQGGPNKEAIKFMETIKDKKIAIFATLGYWSDSEHAIKSLCKGEEIVKENNEVIGRFVCQGPIAPSIIEQFKKMPADNPHAITPAKLKRYKIASRHPSVADIAHAVELFNERIECLDV